MVIAANSPLFSGPYAGDGVATVFDYDFRIYDEAELLVVRTNADATRDTFTLTTDYTVTNVDEDGGGTIVLAAAALLPTGAALTIEPNVTASQDRPFAAQTSITLSQVEAALDKLTSITRQLLGRTSRSVHVAAGVGDQEPLPAPSAGAVLMGNPTGDGYVNGPDVSAVNAVGASAAAAAASAVDAETSADEAAASAATALDTLLDYTGSWLTATAYAVNDLATESGSTYICVEAHTSGTFATDLTAVKWEIFAQKGTAGAGAGDVVAANNLSDLASATTALNNLGVSAFAKTILDDADASAVRATIGAAATSNLLSLIDEDDMVSDSAARPPSQQSVKAYVDATAASSTPDIQTFDVDGTWTKPAGFDENTTVTVRQWGAGGAGARESDGSGKATGGNAGAAATWQVLLKDLGATEAATVGVGGVGRATDGSGAAGTDTTFFGVTTAGGSGGNKSTNTSDLLPDAAAFTTGIAAYMFSKDQYGPQGGAIIGSFPASVGASGTLASGGGGSANRIGADSVSAGGTSVLGGAGGAGSQTDGGDGASHGAGGGASTQGTSGSGAAGRIEVVVG